MYYLEILQALKYPSSCKNSKDWDKIEKEIVKQDEVEQGRGEGAVNALFQNIYGKGSEEVKRAMNKSFVSKIFIIDKSNNIKRNTLLLCETICSFTQT